MGRPKTVGALVYPGAPLDDEERAILHWLSNGSTMEEITAALKMVSVHAVKYRVKLIYTKLGGARNATEAVYLAGKLGWFDYSTGTVRKTPVPPGVAGAVQEAVRESFDQVQDVLLAEVRVRTAEALVRCLSDPQRDRRQAS